MIVQTAPPGPRQLAEALRVAGVDHAVSVPDWIQLPLYKWLCEEENDVRVIPCCAEDEAVGVAAGLTMTGRVPVVLIQNQGFYAAVNNIRAIALDSAIPLVFVIGQFGREVENFGLPSEQSRRRITSLLPGLLDTMDVPYRVIESREDIDAIGWAFEQRAAGRTVAVVLGRAMLWEDET